MIVNNLDVAGIIRRCRRFRYECVKSVSSGLAATTSNDVARMKSFLSAIIVYADWVVAQPELDLPESAPLSIDLGEPEELTMPENEALVDMEALWTAMDTEMGNSQSARMATGLISHDERRLRDLVGKADSFLDNYIAQVQPLDLPESAPLRAQTGAGRSGV